MTNTSNPSESHRGGCLSQWRIWQAATDGKATLPARERQHLEACAICAQTVQEEMSQAQQLTPDKVPTHVAQRLNATRTRRLTWATWVPLASMGAACAAAACLLLIPRPSAEVRIKGEIAVHLSVKRGADVVAYDVPWTAAPTLEDGDRLRLRVLAPLRWLTLWAQDGGQWKELFKGELPNTGWLPIGLRYDASSATPLRLLACSRLAQGPHTPDQMPEGCKRIELSL